MAIFKEYPKVVMMKKGLQIAGVTVIILIVLLILHNMISDKKPKTQNAQDRAVRVSNTNGADTDWYKNETTKKPVLPVAMQTPSEVANGINGIAPAKTQEDQADAKAQSQELKKAMSSPITANQLLSDQKQESNANASTGSGAGGTQPISASAGDTSDQNMQAQKEAFLAANKLIDPDYLSGSLKDPMSAYEIQAGTEIPGILIQGVDSDLPGDVIGQVRSNVYDSISGRYLLIPQGTKIFGRYNSHIAYGQDRVQVAWNRLIFPNGKSIDLDGMIGSDTSGYSGFNDEVDNHYGKIGMGILLSSALVAAPSLVESRSSSDNPWAAPSFGQAFAQNAGNNIANTGAMITQKNISIQPTIKIRQGYEFVITVNKDMVFPGSYDPSYMPPKS